MNEMYVIFWAAWLLLAIELVFQFVGMRLMVAYFPEGRRWWMLPAQLGSLAFFATAVLFSPWR